MNTYEKYPVGGAYLLSANGERVGPALLLQSGGVLTIESAGVVKDVTDYTDRETSKGLSFTKNGSELLLSQLSLSDAKTIFPNTIRKFKSVDSLVASVSKEIMNSNSYNVSSDTGSTISITVGEDGTVLELIRVDEDGELYYRTDRNWTQVSEDDDMPTIYDQSVIDIDPDDADLAIEYYDENVSAIEDISKEDMLEFAALVQ